MRLLSISYKENDWELKNLKLGEVNLLVGKNGVGKTRTTSLILMASWIISKSNFISKDDDLFELSLEFSNNNDIINYSLKYHRKKIVEENIFINNISFLSRTINKGIIKSQITNNFNEVYPPEDKLLLHVNRDIKNYPFLEDIHHWAKTFSDFTFSDIHPEIPDNKKMNHVQEMNQDFKFLIPERQKNITKQLNYIGYNVENISSQEQGDLIFLNIKEKNIDKLIPSYELSQGTIRALYTLTILADIVQNKYISTIVIDDLCEGLDYERATKLGKIVFQTCKENNVQLIASSNDMFLMDVVDIEYWNILQREGNVVTSINKHTHPDLFENFKFTGLSNFHFFADDYLNLINE